MLSLDFINSRSISLTKVLELRQSVKYSFPIFESCSEFEQTSHNKLEVSNNNLLNEYCSVRAEFDKEIVDYTNIVVKLTYCAINVLHNNEEPNRLFGISRQNCKYLQDSFKDITFGLAKIIYDIEVITDSVMQYCCFDSDNFYQNFDIQHQLIDHSSSLCFDSSLSATSLS